MVMHLSWWRFQLLVIATLTGELVTVWLAFLTKIGPLPETFGEPLPYVDLGGTLFLTALCYPAQALMLSAAFALYRVGRVRLYRSDFLLLSAVIFLSSKYLIANAITCYNRYSLSYSPIGLAIEDFVPFFPMQAFTCLWAFVAAFVFLRSCVVASEQVPQPAPGSESTPQP